VPAADAASMTGFAGRSSIPSTRLHAMAPMSHGTPVRHVCIFNFD
jgi:hypothetical protein